MVARTTITGVELLIRFEVSNFRSILSHAELSMVAVDGDRPEARVAPGLGLSLLPVAAIYGPNASGKSNIIAALAWLQDAIQNSLRFWEEEIPLDRFRFTEPNNEPSTFAIEFLLDDVRFEYLIELDSQEVQYEALFHFPEKKRRRIFERDPDGLKLQRGLGNISGTRELLTGQTLAISAARRFHEPLVDQFARAVQQIQVRGLKRRWRRLLSPQQSTERLFVSAAETASEGRVSLTKVAPEDREQALALLKLADLGIDDVSVDLEDVSTVDGEPARRRVVRLVHRGAKQRIPFELAEESEGTRTWYQLIGPVLAALKQGSVLLFDELDASLHPTLSTQLIRLFHDPTVNPRGAQLIFTSHDTSLLSHLNRDEVWLTEKGSDGATRLGALAEFAGERVRRSVNLESAYLHGRFGALPDVDRTELLRTLGLIG